MEGHAGFAHHGHDIVCAGASALAQASLLGLQDLIGCGVISFKRAGCMKVMIDEDKVRKPAVKAVLRTLELGLLAMAKAYPDYLTVLYEDLD